MASCASIHSILNSEEHWPIVSRVSFDEAYGIALPGATPISALMAIEIPNVITATPKEYEIILFVIFSINAASVETV